MASDRDWLVCTSTEASLDRLEPQLTRAIEASDVQLRAIASHLLEQQGKRLRPALAFLAATFGSGRDADDIMRLATALELLHVGSLYHDDVMDRTDRRRNVESANARWGNVLAVYGGTYLFARAATLFAGFGAWANYLAGDAIVKLATGQLLEVEHAFDLALSEPELFDILLKKTATLFELPLRLGSFIGGASEERVEGLASYGRELGLAFQLADDALDFIGDEVVMGKRTGRDLRVGAYSLPVLRAQMNPDCGARLRDLLEKLDLADDDIATASILVRQSGAVDATLSAARASARRAQQCLEVLPDGTARTSLYRLAEYVVTRAS